MYGIPLVHVVTLHIRTYILCVYTYTLTHKNIIVYYVVLVIYVNVLTTHVLHIALQFSTPMEQVEGLKKSDVLSR